jgi:two-component system CheB/CheR fusion protein
MPSTINPPHTVQDFPIVGVGASAGGLDAFRRLLNNIPENPKMAFVLIQHLSPTHESLLPEILAPETSLPVHEITDDINLAPNHVYIIPENKMVTAIDGKLKLGDREPRNQPNLPIDIFFSSLAEVHGGFARGVVLSGTGFDGTQGLKSIKECGGATFVQNPDTAEFDGMLNSAIKAGAADFILEVEEIPGQLQHIDHAYLTSHAFGEDSEPMPKSDEDVFKQIIRLLRLRTGNDFSHYKQPTIRRRIARRMVMTKKEEPAAYLSYLRNNKAEQDFLFNDILIPVSYFFRDSKIFDSLKESIFPDIIEKKKEEDSIRVWVAGCSTGEEAYSIAILMHEYLEERQLDVKVQLFASDISENVISKARAAIYSKQEVSNVSEKRLSKYFSKIDGVYHINKQIRDICVFAVHNFIKDPPFAKMDLISCRNVLIYLDPFLQKKALTTFHYSLKKQGVLFLGKSESAAQLNNLFAPIAKSLKMYSKKQNNTTAIPVTFERYETSTVDKHVMEEKKTSEPDYQKLAMEILFSKYTPAGVIINEHKDIVHFHGDTGPFLLPPPGKPNFNIFKMLREGLAFELRNALVKAKGDTTVVSKEGIILKGMDYVVNLEVVPLDNETEQHYLILFNKCVPQPDEKTSAGKRKDADKERLKQLEAELEQMREDIRRVTEDQEAANEELQSANEELLSNSEELQTLNEELETSAEELQSNNEELITVNDELMDRQEQLSMARMYSEAIVETIREPLLVLDKELRIKSANASFYRYFRTTDIDTEGRILFDIGSGQWNVKELRLQLERLQHDKARLDDFEIKAVFPELGERTILVNARPIVNDNIADQLILFAIEDITGIRAANNLLTLNNRELEENNKELTSFSYIASHDLQEPLRKIHTFTKLIMDTQDGALTESTKRHLERIMVSTDRMQQLIDDLLKYSHINNTDELHFEDTDITLLIEDIQQELKETIEEKGGLISYAKMPALSVLPTLMRQVFLNLISNSLKYSKPDVAPNIKIYSEIVSGKEIKVYGGDENISYCKIKVVDNGIGFPQEQAYRIFEPFQRLHGKDKYEGTGIGLAICKKIVLKHKGVINAESQPGKGTTFNLYLPL